ncbi:hypothetical protein, partial [Microbacterium sp. NPDC087868]|uniref:hypothetical protein n=1 Tax=Microbacterium sp. NPDC087868 TaxID=3364195 RepID=UPI00384B5F58
MLRPYDDLGVDRLARQTVGGVDDELATRSDLVAHQQSVAWVGASPAQAVDPTGAVRKLPESGARRDAS